MPAQQAPLAGGRRAIANAPSRLTLHTPSAGMASPAAPPSLQLLRWRSRAPLFMERTGGLELPMLRIPAGRFLMGSPPEEEGRNDDEDTPRQVTLAEFLISRTPITVAQWRAVALDFGDAFRPLEPGLEAADSHPITGISHEDACEFCRRLSERIGRDYRLPSEAQWEYACRAGTSTPFNTGITISPELANYNGNVAYGPGPQGAFRQQTTPVAQFPANAWGVHDMHGNVWEWCEAPADAAAAAKASEDDALGVMRGGSWNNHPGACRSACRFLRPRRSRLDITGFRVVCLPPGP